jgi:glycosyltransferase involved in cell wall biosynthesis
MTFSDWLTPSRPERLDQDPVPPAELPGPAKTQTYSWPYRPVSPELAITPSVCVIIPALNEGANLPHVLGSLPRWVDEVILVDGRSTDDTVAVARRLRPDITVILQRAHGKGDALQCGFAACTADIIVTMDADGSTDGREMVRFVSALAAGADFAKGSRFASGGGSRDITTGRRCGNRILSTLVNWMFGTRYTDLCYGYNAFWARHLHALAVDSPGFEVEALMGIRAARAGLLVHEVPSFELPRLHGMSKLRVAADGWRIMKVIARERSRRGRLRRCGVPVPGQAAPAHTAPAQSTAESQGDPR